MLTSMRKRKEKHTIDKEIQDQMKEIKQILTEGKILLEKANTISDYQSILLMFNKGISKLSSTHIANTHLLYYYRGLCYFKLKELEKAEKDFLEGISQADDKSKVPILHSLGKVKLEMSQNDPSFLEDAIKCFQKAIDFSNNTDGESYLSLAKIYRKMKNNYQAIKEATNAIKFIKLPFQAYIQRGISYREIGEVQNSIEDFIKACELNKLDPVGFFNLGASYLLVSKYDLALQKLTTAIQLNSNEPQYLNYKGLALYFSGQYEISLNVFRQTLKLYETKNIRTEEVGECWFNYGNVLMQLNKNTQALQAFSQARKVQLSSQIKLKIFYGQGLTYEETKNNLAVEKFTKALELLENDKQNQLYLSSLYHLAYNLYIHKEYDEALGIMNKLTEGECQDQCIFQLRGKIYMDIEHYEKALKDFQMVVGMNPTYPQIYFYLGCCKTNLKQIDAAIADFFRALELGSRNIGIFNGISYAYLIAQKPGKALVYSNFALEKAPNNEAFLIQRSMVYLELKERIKGIQDLTNSLKINKNNPLIYYKRGLSYYQNKQFNEAITDLEKALTLSPAKKIQSDIYYLIGISKANLEKFQQAIEPLSNAINLCSQPKFYHERAKCYLLLEMNEEALNDLNKVLKDQESNAFAYFRRALAHKALKAYELAADDFMRARELAPDNPLLIINKKQIYGVKYRKLCDPGEEQ